jgi:5'-deoxynucleotidase YfbR-like HD superfamily hydrolase
VKQFKHAAEAAAAADVLDGVAENVLSLLDEMHDLSTIEARLVEAAEELQIIAAAMYYAKENRGDMSEYRRDVARYDSLGIEPAEHVAEIIKKRLEEYLGDHPYWELGYKQAGSK